MSLDLSGGRVLVTDSQNRVKFDSNKRTPIVLFKGRHSLFQWYEHPRLKWPGSYSSMGMVNSHESTDSLVLANYGTHYSTEPHFILGSLKWVDNFGASHNTIAGSKQHVALSMMLPNTHESYNATEHTVAGLGHLIYHDLYIDRNNNARFDFRFLTATYISADPRNAKGALENSHIGTLPLARYESPWEYRRYDGVGTLDYIVGAFIG